jgi:hypothetical protein
VLTGRGTIHNSNHERTLTSRYCAFAVFCWQIFAGYQEGPLNFRPTYKYDKGSNSFDTSTKQVHATPAASAAAAIVLLLVLLQLHYH